MVYLNRLQVVTYMGVDVQLVEEIKEGKHKEKLIRKYCLISEKYMATDMIILWSTIVASTRRSKLFVKSMESLNKLLQII